MLPARGSEEEVTTAFESMDIDGNKKIDFDECSGVSKLEGIRAQE